MSAACCKGLRDVLWDVRRAVLGCFGPLGSAHLVQTIGCVTACSVDPFSKKDWYDIKAPSSFSVRNVGKTLVTRTQGTKVGPDACAAATCTASQAVAWTCCRCFGRFLRWCFWMQIASDGLKGRVFECNLADLQGVRLCWLWPA